MTQEIKVQEGLAPCPFCGGEAVLKVSDHPFREGFHTARINCLKCHSSSNALSDLPSFFPSTGKKSETLDEIIKELVEAWNNRTGGAVNE